MNFRTGYDLVTAAERFEFVHPIADDCLADALRAVPDEVRAQAAVIASYLQHMVIHRYPASMVVEETDRGDSH